eukprot:TRINITY_DN7183_c0_g1_i1.p1 TRINITY_DN7183_c0_g1~~TRINITY_DN7183_c0_g1_i1.p1  ORF type:complete len:107 (+),score=10.34 TRINITY_DN7183_c0_g1_i1:465-785(+)
MRRQYPDVTFFPDKILRPFGRRPLEQSKGTEKVRDQRSHLSEPPHKVNPRSLRKKYLGLKQQRQSSPQKFALPTIQRKINSSGMVENRSGISTTLKARKEIISCIS